MNLIGNLIEYTVKNYEEGHWYIFYDTINIIKKNINTEDIKLELLDSLVGILPLVKNSLNKIIIIETFVSFYSNKILEGSTNIVIENNKKLLDEYLFSLRENNQNINVNDTKECLDGFNYLGVEVNYIVSKMIKYLDKKTVVRILIVLSIVSELDIMQNYPELFEDFELAKGIYCRANIISTFMLITHPLASKYEHINCISTEYSNLSSAIVDWGWNKPGSSKYLVDKKYFTKREGRILEKLGELLNSNQKATVEDKIKLYNDFFEDKDPCDVMFLLPLSK